MIAAKDQFADGLRDVGAAGASSTRRTAGPDDLRLEVRDVGPITFPVPVRQAKQLCLVGRPARFGKGEQTLLDRGVRDTWEIPRSRIKIDKRQWDRTLRPTLDGIRADLGLPPGCVLTAEFHSMLVYGPGQFFAPHQDSEKADTMIGTLVVTLPSDSQGGALVVQHGGESVTYRSSKTSLSFVAFYAGLPARGPTDHLGLPGRPDLQPAARRRHHRFGRGSGRSRHDTAVGGLP